MSYLNTEANISSFVLDVQEHAFQVIRDTAVLRTLVMNKNDKTGLAPRDFYQLPTGTALSIAESTDLSGAAWTPTAGSTLTPAEIGLQYFVSDSRVETKTDVEDVMVEAARELGLAASDKIESDLATDVTLLTGATIGTAGSALSWANFYAAVTCVRAAVKSRVAPLVAVLHEYQWYYLAKAASIAAAAATPSTPQFSDRITSAWYVQTVDNVDIYVSTLVANNATSGTAGVWAKDAIALDWRRPIRIEAERDASRRGVELNMSGIYAHGIVRGALGAQIISACAAPTGA